uniref:Ribosomal protein S7 n=1 Tax=Heterorhabditis bacteriophora TaxID=37862 RepID=A0A1I7WC09_HETBA
MNFIFFFLDLNLIYIYLSFNHEFIHTHHNTFSIYKHTINNLETVSPLRPLKIHWWPIKKRMIQHYLNLNSSYFGNTVINYTACDTVICKTNKYCHITFAFSKKFVYSIKFLFYLIKQYFNKQLSFICGMPPFPKRNMSDVRKISNPPINSAAMLNYSTASKNLMPSKSRYIINFYITMLKTSYSKLNSFISTGGKYRSISIFFNPNKVQPNPRNK